MIAAQAAMEAAASQAAWERSGGRLEEQEEEVDEYVVDPARTAKLLVSGGIAGALSRTATAPIDRLKMLLQIQEGRTPMTMRQGFKQMAAEGTMSAFFRGNGTNVVKIAPETAIKLTLNDVLKHAVVSDPDDITPAQRMLAGALAGGSAQALIYPLELVRTRLAVCPSGTYGGIFDCAGKVLRQEGVRAFYRGIVPSMIGILPYAGVDIAAFELLKERLLDEYDNHPPAHVILGAGMLSSSLAQFVSYPLALTRTRLQAQGVGGQAVRYTGMMDVLRRTFANEGFRGLYKGAGTNLCKLAPAAGISWFVFEETKLALGVDIWACAEELQPVFSEIDRLIAANVARTQRAFATARIGPHHFLGSTGYGHGDLGRGALDQIMADVMGMEAAAVRIQFVSGTHAIACALFGVLRPGDELLSVAGSPYDTLEEVIGVRGTPGSGSLAEHGVGYRVLPLAPGSGAIDWGALATAVKPETRMALLQRSCGYADRPTLSLEDIRRAVQVIKAQSPRVVVAVDNCYGEFTDTAEPGAVGADLCMGSLIKNPGGTLVPGGGYVAGKRHLVDAALARLTAPGIGSEAGAVNGETLRLMFQGLYAAPQTTGEALKGGRLAAAVMQGAGYGVTPASGACRPWSAITAIRLGSPHAMAAFASAVQASSPIGSYVTPTPGVTPGYADPVVFADGTFVAGSTSELGAD
ncbi:hypothetical protein APUTEX25_001234 [Auxenochlorella protothecoides]|uniref:Uncharacterized protein n=1 Tax=Auxenochlorella protothecoides TaxID=3075 RepID=A0A3M7KQD7_AUXPR|nr:hypothetical protein APUTEX25_001234 [Auxenochlorella protothecoides]|eukprot:RMZ52040.1 hypothetical protein APUTEX25_001234 [Auxenochlorella protothecoides]